MTDTLITLQLEIRQRGKIEHWSNLSDRHDGNNVNSGNLKVCNGERSTYGWTMKKLYDMFESRVYIMTQ